MIKKFFTYLFITLFIYFAIGGLIFNHLFPPQKPNYQQYFEKNKVFGSEEEGLTQEVKKVENNLIHLKITVKPFAAGPPEHVHYGFDENFIVEKGILSVKINGEVKKVSDGEKIIIPRGTSHKPFNDTSENVILNDTTCQYATMPCEFAYSLCEMYPVMDAHGAESPKVLLKIASIGGGFDTWLPHIPKPMQQLIRWLLSPTARLINQF
jgi:mannose-6-phosphate isomerase-like protein (cupin superfamily)